MPVLISLVASLVGLVLGGSIIGLFMMGPAGVFAGPIIALFGFWLLPLIWLISLLEIFWLRRTQITQGRFILYGIIVGFLTCSWVGLLNFINASSHAQSPEHYSEAIRFGSAFVVGGPLCGALVNFILFKWVTSLPGPKRPKTTASPPQSLP